MGIKIGIVLKWLSAGAHLLGLLFWLFVAVHDVRAAGPVETNVFAVQGVDADETDVDAASAKNKALVDVQMKAFHRLVDERGTAEMSAALEATEPKDVLPYLKSLSIEEESVAPGRYIGKFTVRFLPGKMAALFQKYGVRLDSKQSPAILVLPVWTEEGTVKLWEANPWRDAWTQLGATQARVPIIVALGDAEDSKMITAPDVVANDAVKLEALRRRYDVEGVLTAFAEPAPEGGIKVRIEGQSPIGKVRIEKVYTGDDGTIQGSALAAVKRFQDLMTSKFNSDEAKIAERSGIPQSLPVSVPFSSPSQWNGIRSRILSAPGVRGVDVTSLAPDGAVISLLYTGELADLGASFQSAGLQFNQVGSNWVIEPL